jgi:V8-like Glu-specific endopeptidase
MCGRPGCMCGRSSRLRFDDLDASAFLDDQEGFAALDDEADWADWDSLDAFGSDRGADQFTFGTDNRFRVRSQPRQPSTRLFPFNTVCLIRPASGGGFFSGVLVAPRVVLTVKHALFANIDPPACGPRLSTATTRSKGAVIVRPGLDQTQRPGQRTIARPFAIRAPAAAQFAHPRVDIGLIVLPRAFRAPTRFMLLQPRSDAQTRTRLVTLAGYPGDMPFGTMWAHSDRVLSLNPTHLMYQIDLCPGQSGGPVWLLGSGGTRILLAIQSQQVESGVPPGQLNCGVRTAGSPIHNCGVRLTCDVIRWILDICRRRGVRAPNVDQPTFRRCPRRAA